MFKKLSRKLIIGIALAGTIGTGAGIWYYTHKTPTLIYDLDLDRDMQPILDLFASDSYWLDANYDISQEKYRNMLRYGYLNDNPMFPGLLKFKVLRDKGVFVGFTGYHKTTPRAGKILFVAVHPDMRGKRYGQMLVETALAELKKLGANQVELVTRTSNFAAQKLYLRCGFKETWRDDEYVAYGYWF